MSVPASHPAPETSVSLEAFGLELALQTSEEVVNDFEHAFGPALDSAGARLLFAMRLSNSPDADYVAAVSVGEGAARQFLIVTRPAKGDVSVEPAEQSSSPVARLAPAFAEVMERWKTAA